MIKIITTVGTSIFTNYQKTEVRAKLGRKYVSIDTAIQRTETLDNHEIPALIFYDDNYDKYRVYVRELEENISDLWFSYPDSTTPNVNASAEISSILKIVEQAKESCEVHLVATDTLQSVLAAELIVKWFDKFQQKKVIKVLFQRPDNTFKSQKDSDYVVKDLRLRSQQDYRIGFMNLIELLERVNKKEKTILNITGGFKGIIPIVTLFSQLYEIPLNYLYEEGLESGQDNLIILGNLPIHFDLGYIEKYVEFLEKPEKLVENKILDRMYSLGLLYNKNLPAELSVIGKLIKNKLESDDLPFHKTTIGYLVEYKIYEYFNNNNIIFDFDKPHLGYKLSSDPDKDLEDADLWFENKSEIIIAEIKPSGISSKEVRKKIRKIFGFLPSLTNKSVREFWIILYSLNNDYDLQNWSDEVFSEVFLQEFPAIKFCVKTINISPNIIDGTRNRIKYQEFMRNPINEIFDVCEKQFINK